MVGYIEKLIIEYILKEIRDIYSFTNGLSFEEFEDKKINQKAVSMSLCNIGKASKQFREDFSERHKDFPWQQLEVVRNISERIIGTSFKGEKKIWGILKEELPVLENALLKKLREAEFPRNTYIMIALHENLIELDLGTPDVRFAEPSRFPTPTTHTMLSPDYKELLLNHGCDWGEEPDIWFYISYEVRHGWQIARREEFWRYATRVEALLREYNLQPAEIDAYAWAAAMVREQFGVVPELAKNLGEKAWEQISLRMDEIHIDEGSVRREKYANRLRTLLHAGAK